MKLKNNKKIILSIFILLFVSFIGYILFFTGNSNKNDDKRVDDSKDNHKKMEAPIIEIEGELFDKLSLEGGDEILNNKIKDYIDNGGVHYIHDEVEYNGYLYKNIQITFTEHKHVGNYIADYLMRDEEIKKLFMRELEDDRILSYDDGSKIMDELYKEIFQEFEHTVGGTLAFERYNNFDFIEDWAVSAIIKYDNNGRIDSVLSYEGAVGGTLKISDERLEWDICLLDKMNCYYYGMYQYNESEKTPIACCLISGTMYKMILDDAFKVEKIINTGNTVNNTLNDLCVCSATDGDYLKNIPAVKNYNLLLSDFINNEEYKNMLVNSFYTDENTRKLFGCEHELSYYGWDGDYYFTKDGYIIQTGRVPQYAKIDIKEAYKIDKAEWYKLFEDNLFIGEINKEFEQYKEEKDNNLDVINVVNTIKKKELSIELKDEKFCEEICDYINKGKVHQVVDCVSWNGNTIKYIQICRVKHDCMRENEDLQIGKYYLKNNTFSQRVKKQLSDECILTQEEYDALYGYRGELKDRPLLKSKDGVGDTIVFKRDEEFGFMEKWSIAALVKVNSQGKVIEIIGALKGATATGLTVEGDTIKWEVFVGEELEYYYVGVRDEHNKRKLLGEGLVSGTIYEFCINSDNEVDDIKQVRKSYDNDYKDFCNRMYMKRDGFEKYGIKFKNYEFTLKDIINNSDIYAEGLKGNCSSSTAVHYFGNKHVYRNILIGPGYFFTKDGYTLYFDDTFVKYFKLSKEEFIDKYGRMTKEEIYDKQDGLLFELVVNPKLLS